jgi:hypothetical protein
VNRTPGKPLDLQLLRAALTRFAPLDGETDTCPDSEQNPARTQLPKDHGFRDL